MQQEFRWAPSWGISLYTGLSRVTRSVSTTMHVERLAPLRNMSGFLIKFLNSSPVKGLQDEISYRPTSRLLS